MNLRRVEGEAIQYRGVIYIVKGFQHPEGKLIAYPRYDVLSKRKLLQWESRGSHLEVFWDCIKRSVPVIPMLHVTPVIGIDRASEVERVRRTLESILGLEVYLTGSALVCHEFHDLDFIIYGADESTVEKLEELVRRGIFKTSISLLINEYFEKHMKAMNLENYLLLKKDSVLHFRLQGYHVNLKLVEYKRGFVGCRDPVLNYMNYTGTVEVVYPINPRIVPARYESTINGKHIMLESFRELYAELKPGLYYAINARIEERESGRYLVPDTGVLVPLKIY